jgi:hypothetical protein
MQEEFYAIAFGKKLYGSQVALQNDLEQSGRHEKTLKKLLKTAYQQPVCLPLKTLVEYMRVKKNITSLTVKIGDKIFLIKLHRIVYIDADEKYVFIHTVNTCITSSLTEKSYGKHMVSNAIWQSAEMIACRLIVTGIWLLLNMIFPTFSAKSAWFIS